MWDVVNYKLINSRWFRSCHRIFTRSFCIFRKLLKAAGTTAEASSSDPPEESAPDKDPAPEEDSTTEDESPAKVSIHWYSIILYFILIGLAGKIDCCDVSSLFEVAFLVLWPWNFQLRSFNFHLFYFSRWIRWTAVFFLDSIIESSSFKCHGRLYQH